MTRKIERSQTVRKSRRTAQWVRLLFLLAAVLVGWWGVHRNPWFEERRLRAMSLADLRRESADRPDDPIALYYTGLRMVQIGDFGGAEPLLKQGALLDPNSARMRDAWAQALTGVGRPTAAYEQLKQYVGDHANSAAAHKIFGKFFFGQSSMKRTSEEMARAVALAPRDGEAWAYLAAARDSLADATGTLQAAEQAAHLRPNNAGDHLLLAGLYARANRSEEAGREYARAVQLAPRLAAAHREYAHWLADNRPVEAESEAHMAVTLDPVDAAAWKVLGQILARAADRRTAREPFEKAATLDPNDPEPARALWDLNRSLNDDVQASRWRRIMLDRQHDYQQRRALLEAIEVHPDQPEPHLQFARYLARHGDAAECTRQEALALRCTPDAPPALTAAARELIAAGHPAEAVPLAQSVIAHGGASPDSQETLGDALLAVDRWHDASVAYQAAAEADPARMPILRARLKDYFSRRAARPTPAEQAFRDANRLERIQVGPKQITPQVEQLALQAVMLGPTNPKYLKYLLHIQVAKRRNDQAIETARRLLAVRPNDSTGHALLAILLLDRAADPAGLAEAETHLNAATGPADAATRHYGLGVLALKRRNGATAVRELEQSIQLDPNSDVAYYKLVQAEKLVGDASAAARANARHEQIQSVKKAEARVLDEIAQHPDRPEGYTQAAAYFDGHGLHAQADAIRAEGRRRSGTSAH